MEYTVENLCGFLMRSKLHAPDAVKALQQRWQTEGGAHSSETAAFLRWLVAQGLLTDYQAQLLARGQVDDFFLNQYKILERVRRGRFAGVFKAIHPLGQVVDIKVLPLSRARDVEVLSRFHREAKLALKLQHPNIIRSFQVGEARGLHYLVMEHLEGETLAEVLARRKRLPAPEAARIAHQALLGLQHFHEQHLVHRDLHPGNLLLYRPRRDARDARDARDTTLDAQVKILDIWLAREMFDDSGPQERTTELTAERVILGSPDYLAPEQASDPRTVDIRADIYSVGCILYHMIAGEPPFADSNPVNQMIRHSTQAPRPLRDFDPGIPEGFEQILNWMMAKQPAQRYPVPLRAAQALQMYLLTDTEPALEESAETKQYLQWIATGHTGAELVAAPAPAAISATTALPAGLPAAVPAEAVPVAASALQPMPAGVPAPALASLATGSAQAEAAKSGGTATSEREHRKRKKRPESKGRPILVAQKASRPLDFAAPATPAPTPGAGPAVAEVSPPAAPTSVHGRLAKLGLTRRDVIVFAAGAGSTLLGVLGMVAAHWFWRLLFGARDLMPEN